MEADGDEQCEQCDERGQARGALLRAGDQA
jgi:hypothetical protein